MQANSAQFIRATSQISQAYAGRMVLREGSRALVRIIADKGNGKYEVSVAGARANLKSAETLKPGQTFTGIIGFKDGVTTIKIEGTETEKPELRTLSFIQGGGIFELVDSPALTGLLQSFGLPADNFSFQIFQQFKQLGLKLSPQIMRKIRQMALKSPNPQKAMQKLVMLYQKGVSIDSELNFESELESEFEFKNEAKNKNRSERNPMTLKSENFLPNEDGFFAGLQDFFEKALFNQVENYGKLTVLNHLGFGGDKSGENSWVMIPFEVQNVSDESVTAQGRMNLLFSSAGKTLGKLHIALDFLDGQMEKYRFELLMKGSSAEKIRFAVDNVQNPQKMQKISDELESRFEDAGKIHVEIVPFEMIDGTGAALEEFSIAGGFV